MTYNPNYYSEKKMKVEQRRRINLQRFINFAFDFTNEANALTEQFNDIEQQEIESKKMSEGKAKEQQEKVDKKLKK